MISWAQRGVGSGVIHEVSVVVVAGVRCPVVGQGSTSTTKEQIIGLEEVWVGGQRGSVLVKEPGLEGYWGERALLTGGKETCRKTPDAQPPHAIAPKWGCPRQKKKKRKKTHARGSSGADKLCCLRKLYISKYPKERMVVLGEKEEKRKYT